MIVVGVFFGCDGLVVLRFVAAPPGGLQRRLPSPFGVHGKKGELSFDILSLAGGTHRRTLVADEHFETVITCATFVFIQRHRPPLLLAPMKDHTAAKHVARATSLLF